MLLVFHACSSTFVFNCAVPSLAYVYAIPKGLESILNCELYQKHSPHTLISTCHELLVATLRNQSPLEEANTNSTIEDLYVLPERSVTTKHILHCMKIPESDTRRLNNFRTDIQTYVSSLNEVSVYIILILNVSFVRFRALTLRECAFFYGLLLLYLDTVARRTRTDL
jgi:hypothetical protein